MCFYCDCKRAVYATDAPFGLAPRPTETAKSKNGTKPAKKKRAGGGHRRLGAK
jgi:hypothetical protein